MVSKIVAVVYRVKLVMQIGMESGVCILSVTIIVQYNSSLMSLSSDNGADSAGSSNVGMDLCCFLDQPAVTQSCGSFCVFLIGIAGSFETVDR